MYKAMVIGAGFAGAVTARRLAEAGWNVTIIDKRPHIGGNAYDPILPEKGRVHLYGPHIFHTNSKKVFDFLSRFSKWVPYEHVVRGVYENEEFPVPANFETIQIMFPNSYESIIRDLKNSFPQNETLTITQLLSRNDSLRELGEAIFSKIFKDYTEKQWGLSLQALGPTVASRVPIRLNFDNRYFTDKYQFMPRPGYLELFEEMLDHRQISCRVDTTAEAHHFKNFDKVFFSGSLDGLLDFKFGELPYRSLRFKYSNKNSKRFQSVGQVNYTDTRPFTRITEFSYLTGETESCIAHEFPEEHIDGKNEKFYPIPLQANSELHKKYFDLVTEKYPNLMVLGRLGSYKYFNMDQVVAQALKISDDILL
jgi:UDP-galactopyranose mutase